MTVRYCLCDPSGNLTALVTSRHDPAHYPAINDQILKQHPRCEQVGFADLSGSTPSLRMAGGEFCGNATLCTAVLYCHTRSVFRPVSVRVYGISTPFRVEVHPAKNGYEATISLPRPAGIETYHTVLNGVSYDFPCVGLTGIVHAIAPADLPKEAAEVLAKRLADEWRQPAAGVMLWDEAGRRLTPLVYVKQVGTLYWENACASGSVAVCAYLASKTGTVCESLYQPGGVITVQATEKAPLIRLTNTVVLGESIEKEWQP